MCDLFLMGWVLEQGIQGGGPGPLSGLISDSWPRPGGAAGLSFSVFGGAGGERKSSSPSLTVLCGVS